MFKSKIRGTCIGILLVLVITASAVANAASIRVSPIRVFIGAREKISSLTIVNDADEKATIQLKAKAWNQGKGGDSLEDTRELIFFPRIFTLEAKQQRVVRLTLRGPPATDRERTFRLYVRDIPVIVPGETAVRFSLQISIPVFVSPLKEVRQWSLQKADLDKGRLRIFIRNTGNVHIQVQKITAIGHDRDGAELFTRDSSGWYILAGNSRPFTVPLPPSECMQVHDFKVTVQSDKDSREGEFQVSPDASGCNPPMEERKEQTESRQ